MSAFSARTSLNAASMRTLEGGMAGGASDDLATDRISIAQNLNTRIAALIAVSEASSPGGVSGVSGVGGCACAAMKAPVASAAAHAIVSSTLTAGVGALTDADLAAEPARLACLQTKQQLATQSRSIAGNQPRSLLTLFQDI